MSTWGNCNTVGRNLNIAREIWAFRDMWVPVSALFENLEDGVQINDFVECFPGVTLTQICQVPEHAASSFEFIGRIN